VAPRLRAAGCCCWGWGCCWGRGWGCSEWGREDGWARRRKDCVLPPPVNNNRHEAVAFACAARAPAHTATQMRNPCAAAPAQWLATCAPMLMMRVVCVDRRLPGAVNDEHAGWLEPATPTDWRPLTWGATLTRETRAPVVLATTQGPSLAPEAAVPWRACTWSFWLRASILCAFARAPLYRRRAWCSRVERQSKIGAASFLIGARSCSQSSSRRTAASIQHRYGMVQHLTAPDALDCGSDILPITVTALLYHASIQITLVVATCTSSWHPLLPFQINHQHVNSDMRPAQQRLRTLAGDAWRRCAAHDSAAAALPFSASAQQHGFNTQPFAAAARRFASQAQKQPGNSSSSSSQGAAAAARLWPRQLMLLSQPQPCLRSWAAPPSKGWQLEWRACKHSYGHGGEHKKKSIADNGLYLVRLFGARWLGFFCRWCWLSFLVNLGLGHFYTHQAARCSLSAASGLV